MIVMTIFIKILIMIYCFWGSYYSSQSLCRKFYLTQNTVKQLFMFLMIIKKCSFSNIYLSVIEHFVL